MVAAVDKTAHRLTDRPVTLRGGPHDGRLIDRQRLRPVLTMIPSNCGRVVAYDGSGRFLGWVFRIDWRATLARPVWGQLPIERPIRWVDWLISDGAWDSIVCHQCEGVAR